MEPTVLPIAGFVNPSPSMLGHQSTSIKLNYAQPKLGVPPNGVRGPIYFPSKKTQKQKKN